MMEHQQLQQLRQQEQQQHQLLQWKSHPSTFLLEFVDVLCNPYHYRTKGDLNKLSIPQRQRVFEDLAGSTQLPEENVHDLAKTILEVEAQISKIRKKDAFDKAKTMNPDYVADPGFLLMFLRANDYDASKTAHQIVDHFEEKLSLFGEEKLARNIRLDDLSEDDLESLRSGGIQAPNAQDQSGRQLLFFRYSEYKFKRRENFSRASWYLMMSVLEDENVQRRGVVCVAYEVGDTAPSFDFELVRSEMNKQRCLPIRVVGAHYCTSNDSLRAALDLIIHMCTPFFRVRLRAHHGIETECLYQLMTFGIPVQSVPWVGGSDNSHMRWLDDRYRRESRTRVYDAEDEELMQMMCCDDDDDEDDDDDDENNDYEGDYTYHDKNNSVTVDGPSSICENNMMEL